jgi:hypothetical protein
VRIVRALLVVVVAGACALGVSACGDTLQDKPIPHNELESLELSPFPVYWLGRRFAGLQITEAGRDPSNSFTVQYGNCLEGGQSTCVPPLKIVTSPNNSFVPGEGPDTERTTIDLRGLTGYVTERGRAISLATGEVVVSIFAHTPRLARVAAETAVPINYPGTPAAPLPQRLPNTGFGARPLPSQIPNQIRPLG